jgi:hypothetical protein
MKNEKWKMALFYLLLLPPALWNSLAGRAGSSLLFSQPASYLTRH